MLTLLPPDGYQEGHSKKAVRFHEIVTIVFFRTPQNHITEELKRQLACCEEEIDQKDAEIITLQNKIKEMRKIDNFKTLKILELEARVGRISSVSPTPFTSNDKEIQSSTRMSDSAGSHMSVDASGENSDITLNDSRIESAADNVSRSPPDRENKQTKKGRFDQI